MSPAFWSVRRIAAASLLLCALQTTAAATPTPDAQALYQQGLAAGNGGDLRKAVVLMNQALAADPKHFLAQFDLGGAYEALGNEAQALECYRKTTLLRPDFAEARSQLATLYLLHSHDFPRALESFKQALLIKQPYVDPRFSLASTRGKVLLNLAITYAEQKRQGVTVGIVASLLNDPVAELPNSQVERIGRMSERDLASSLTREFGGELDAIRPQLYRGQSAEALRRYQKFAKTHPLEKLRSPLDRWDLLEGLATGHLLTHKPTDAARLFTQAAKVAEELRYGQWQESMWNLACALALSGQAVEAVEALDGVLFIDMVTAHDPGKVNKGPYRRKIATDSDLKSIQNHPALVALLSIYPA